MGTEWYKVVFSKKLDELLELRKHASTQEELDKIDVTICKIVDLIGDVCNKDVTLMDRVNSERENYISNNMFLELLKPIASMEENERRRIFNPIPKLDDSELLLKMDEFFREALDSELYKVFKEMFRSRQTLVHFRGIQSGFKDAESIFLTYYREVYIRLRRNGSISDLTNLAHEYGHGIHYLYNDHIYIPEENDVFIEIVSTFFELLMIDFLNSDEKYRKASSFYRIETLNTTIFRSKQVLKVQEVIRENDSINRIREEIDKCSSLFKYDGLESLESVINKRHSQYIKYLFGFLIAVEIFMIYVKNPNKGLDVLKRVMKIDLSMDKSACYDEIVEFGLVPNSSLDEYMDGIQSIGSMAFRGGLR